MKYARILGAIVLTVMMLYIAQRNSVGAPERFARTIDQYQFEMETVPKGMENSDTTIWLSVVGPFESGQRVVLQLVGGSASDEPPALHAVPMTQKEAGSSEYYIRVPAGARNEKTRYYIAVVDDAGAVLARFARPDGSPFTLRSIGHVPVPVLIGHIAFIFATFFCVAMAALNAFPLIAGKGDVRAMAVWFLAAAVCTFVGGYPLGFAMNWFAFGGIWEGVPFGTDATDNKTQILFIYVLFVTLAAIGSLSRGKTGRDVFSPRVLGWLGLIGFFLQISIYLIPHSIQFSAGLTYAVCYGYTALIVLIYMLGRVGSRTKSSSPAAS
jgi:hypothetical protein